MKKEIKKNKKIEKNFKWNTKRNKRKNWYWKNIYLKLIKKIEHLCRILYEE